ncbi:MAG: serine/threonine protein kinase [Acidobacteriota bacterium]
MPTPSGSASEILGRIKDLQNIERQQELQWEGSFEDYLDIVLKNPQVTRTAFQRLYDMILSHGTEEYWDNKKKIVRYRFFTDSTAGRDRIYGLDIPLMRFVNILKAAAEKYGPERRVLLLHGPVGSSKSTLVRLLKRGLEEYSRTPEGALYSFSWHLPAEESVTKHAEVMPCPMHEEALHLLPEEMRPQVLAMLSQKGTKVEVEGDLCPACRQVYRDLMKRYQSDWTKVIAHVRVNRLVLSEKDRIGIGTFQPKDEKNQDATELTGDINYRKIAEYGTDSDPRAFNFDGEFNIANRGLVEFIEVLKLDVAFLYDLLGASQEHVIKPKKFSQTDIDEVIVGHSVAGHEPLPYRHRGRIGFLTMEELYERFHADPLHLEVLAHDHAAGGARFTPVRSLLRHRFSGEMLTSDQKWGVVETTPNHSIYDRGGETFFPEERHEMLAVRRLECWQQRATMIDVVEGIAGFVRSDVAVAVGGGRLTRPCREGWARLPLPRHATEIRATYDVVADAGALKDLISVLVWYATEGHVNGANGGIVITQANPAELARIQRCYAHISSATGSIDAGATTDSAHRLYLGSAAIATLARHHCGEHARHKRLPDFLFALPEPFLAHAFDELMRTDGTRKLSGSVARTASDQYRERFFDYKTISPMLAAQVGTLATLLGHDHSVLRQERPGKAPAFRIRFVSGDGKRGGRHRRFDARLHRRPAFREWVYDIACDGLHNFVCGVGNVVCHNTNEPEYRKLQNNEFMEALRDRTAKVDIPYITKLDEEIKIYRRDFNAERIRSKHIAPHTIEMAAMWAVLTRLEEPRKPNLTLLQKLKLYNGKSLSGFTEDNIKELRKEAKREGMEGISPRYIQDKMSNALVSDKGGGCVNPFMVLNELESGLRHHSLITSEDQKKRYAELLGYVKQEYEDVAKNEVQRAISADEEAIRKLCANYIDHVKAYTQKEKVKNKYTGQDEEPDERLMRSIEEKIDIHDSRKDDFRREIMNYIGALAVEGKTFDYRTNERLHKALELKLFEDQKDSIKLTTLVSSVVDRETQEKIDIVKSRLIKNFGYCDICATDVLNYVASIFARGDAKA